MTLSELPNIVEISANNLTLLTRINASTFASNLKLTKLSLRNNTALHAIDPAAFSPQSTLKELHLDNANLTDLPVGLLNWTSLDSLTLHGTNLTCTCDLHHIFAATPNEDPPTCADPSSPARHHIPLTSDVCEVKVCTLIYILRAKAILNTDSLLADRPDSLPAHFHTSRRVDRDPVRRHLGGHCDGVQQV